MRAWIFLATAFLVGPGFARPASALSLDQAQAQAEKLNPSLQALDAQVRAADARIGQAAAAYLPRLDLDAQHLFAAEYGIMDIYYPAFGGKLAFPAAFPQDTVDLRAEWTFFDGFRGVRQWQAADEEAEAARLERDYAAVGVREKVAVQFYRALAAKFLAAAAAQSAATLEEHLRLAQDYEDSGGTTHFDVLRVQTQREEALAALQQAQDQADMARLDLAQAMGLSQDARTLEGVLPVPSLGQISAYSAPDLDGRADLRALDLRRQAIQRRACALLSAWLPQVSLFADREYYRYGSFNPEILPSQGPGLPDQEMWGLNLTWNLFDGGLDKGKLDEARAQAQAAGAGKEDRRLAAVRDFASWKSKFRDNVRLYEACLRVLKQSTESVRLARLGLKAGTLTNSEVLDAEMDLSRARAGLVQSQADAAEAFLNIEVLGGDSLER